MPVAEELGAVASRAPAIGYREISPFSDLERQMNDISLDAANTVLRDSPEARVPLLGKSNAGPQRSSSEANLPTDVSYGTRSLYYARLSYRDIPKFDGDDFDYWWGQLEPVLGSYPPCERLHIFRSKLGPKPFRLVQSLLTGGAPLSHVVQVLQREFMSSANAGDAAQELFSRFQEPSESARSFHNELDRLAALAFPESEFDSITRHKIVLRQLIRGLAAEECRNHFKLHPPRHAEDVHYTLRRMDLDGPQTSRRSRNRGQSPNHNRYEYRRDYSPSPGPRREVRFDERHENGRWDSPTRSNRSRRSGDVPRFNRRDRLN